MGEHVWFVLLLAVLGVALSIVALSVARADTTHPVLDQIDAEIEACEAAHNEPCVWVWHGDAEPEGES